MEMVTYRKISKIWGPRNLRDDFRDHINVSYHHGDPHHQFSAIALAMTKPGRDIDKSIESKNLGAL